MFRNKTAWFSSSVPQSCHNFWILEDGTTAGWRTADYLFSKEATCPDTLRVFESKDFLWNKVTVFHSSFLSACEKRQSAKSVCIGHYVLPPASVQDDVRNILGRLIWEREDEQVPTRVLVTRQKMSTVKEKSAEASLNHLTQTHQEMTTLCVVIIQSVTCIQGMSACTTCRNIQVICVISIPGVSDAPTVKPIAACYTHRQTQNIFNKNNYQLTCSHL
ncbi:telomere repeats-binding bouquet formation protein 2 isoform X1 [Thunnus albacares]|uniref:telomere repeats-binding bouquet formation protein 2 isoform X1 n=1 Tax=Thunnus albacares TaxID=8236 RepID=UPI001CF62735|nr:telomere repeats-binding bouquet formation protein 2 isoform X1 [Thunnus albacares]